jgi:hypothetical protein
MSSTGRWVRRGATALGAGVAAVLLSVAPAYAHYNTITLGDVAFASINSGHTAVSVCKKSSRYDYALAQITKNGVTYAVADSTNNGSCNTMQLSGSGWDNWRLCSYWNSGGGVCSSWRAV